MVVRFVVVRFVVVRLVTLVVAPKVALTVTAPVVALFVTDWKPFCERTGPVNVVIAMIFPYIQVRRISPYVV